MMRNRASGLAPPWRDPCRFGRNDVQFCGHDDATDELLHDGERRRALNWVDGVWVGSAAASLTLAAIHLFIWVHDRRAWAHLAFAVIGGAVVGIAWQELAMMHASTAVELASAARWGQVPIFVVFAAIVLFLRRYFGTGRLWLAAMALGTRLLALLLGFAFQPNLHLRQLAVRQIEFLGQTVATPHGVASPWIWIGRASALLLVAFVVDASAAHHRRGDPDARRRAWRVGGSLAFFVAAATVYDAFAQQGVIESPYLITPFFLVAVVAMGAELTNDVTDYRQLADVALEAKDNLAVEQTEVLADKGYYNAAEVSRCVEQNITPLVPKADTSAKQARLHA